MSLIDKCLCGAERWPRLFERHGLLLAECSCSLIHLVTDRAASDYEAQYRGAYHAAIDRHPGCIRYADRYAHDLSVAAIRWRTYCEICPRPDRIVSALDVGCANGAFVDYLREQGLHAWGVDPDPAMGRSLILPRHARHCLGRFDLVTYHDVLEHVLDPEAELKTAREHVRPEGKLVIDVPDVSVPEGGHHFKAEHPWYFTIAALKNLLNTTGFRPFFTDRPIAGKLVMYAEPA